MNRFSILILSGLLFTCTVYGGCQQDNNGNGEVTEGRTIEYVDEVTFLGMEGNTITTIGVAVADEASERNMGLMDVTDLPPDRGMLFVYPDEEPRSFWMVNTPLPLDIIYVDAEMEIINIYHNTQPFSRRNLPSGDPARYVVETNGGFCISNDIQEGMSIRISGEVAGN